MALARAKPKKDWSAPHIYPDHFTWSRRFLRIPCFWCNKVHMRIYYHDDAWWVEDEQTLISRHLDFKRELDPEEGTLCDGCAASRWFGRCD